MIATQQSAEQIRDYLKQALDRDDGLLVTRLQDGPVSKMS